MNNQRINNWIAPAAEALVLAGIAVNGKIQSGFRGQISSFGAAISMGSLKAAAAFFAKQGNANVPRELLLKAIHYVVTGTLLEPIKIFEYICSHDDVYTREKYLDAAIALKLAMNLYELVEEEKNHAKFEPSVQ